MSLADGGSREAGTRWLRRNRGYTECRPRPDPGGGLSVHHRCSSCRIAEARATGGTELIDDTDSLGGRERRPSRRAQCGQHERVEGHRNTGRRALPIAHGWSDCFHDHSGPVRAIPSAAEQPSGHTARSWAGPAPPPQEARTQPRAALLAKNHRCEQP